MKITIINQFYPPDLSPTGKLAASLAEHRADQGDQVTVVAGEGYADTIQDAQELPDESSSSTRSLRVHRVWTPRLGRKSLWRRITDYAVFFVLTVWTTIRLPKQDVIICLTTPPFIAIAGVLHKLFHPRTRLILWNMDCYPEVAERSGVIRRNGVMSRLMQFSNWFLEASIDHIVCLDNAMQDLMLSRRSKTFLSVVSNWERSHLFPAGEVLREQAPKRSREFIVLYSGNMGQGHCFGTAIESAQWFHDQNVPVRFVFTGGGGQCWQIQQDVIRRQLSNVDFLGYISASKLRALQQSAGCSLIALRDDMLGVMSPSKLHGSLAMGLPILYVGPRGSNVDDAISQFECGASLRHGDVKGVVEFVSRLRSDSAARAEYSERARRAFEAEYCDHRALPKFDHVIRSVVDRSGRRAA